MLVNRKLYNMMKRENGSELTVSTVGSYETYSRL